MNPHLDELADQMYEKLKDERRITPILVMKHAGVDFETADKICIIIWGRLRLDARKLAEEIYAR